MAAAEETKRTRQTRIIVPLDVDAGIQGFQAEDMRPTCGLHAQASDPRRRGQAPHGARGWRRREPAPAAGQRPGSAAGS